MKKRNLLLIILGIFIFVSCQDSDDFLTRVNPNTYTPETFWQTEEEVDQWLTSAYGSLVFGDGGSGAGLNFARFFAWATVYRSDEYKADFGNPWGQANAEFALDATNPVVNNLWRSFWSTIFRANHVIERVPEMDNLTAQKKEELIGEAEFLRGFSYFYLINLWESIPLITEVPINEDEFYPSQATRDQVWDQIITDFTNAKEGLRTITQRDDANLGRATWGAAIGHLGKAYLYRQQWSQAAAQFKELIDAGIYSLVPNYRDNGNDLNENNSESIFEAQTNDAIDRAFSTWRSRDGGPRLFAGSHGVVEPWLVNTFLEEMDLNGEVETRAQATLIFRHPDNTLYGGLTYEEAYADLIAADPTFDDAYWKKYRNVETRANDNSGFQSGINIRLMRYADVLLMHAEAENEANGPTAAGIASFDEVRARANMSAIGASTVISAATQDDFRDAIKRERVLELSGEDNRWMDLKRWGVLAERFSDPDVLSGAMFDINRHEYYPIPQYDMNLNPNLNQYADY